MSKPRTNARECIVRRCPNTSDNGGFEGPICGPCARALAGDDRSKFAESYIFASLHSVRLLLETNEKWGAS